MTPADNPRVDIVELLRLYSHATSISAPLNGGALPLFAEAAEEIERLRATIHADPLSRMHMLDAAHQTTNDSETRAKLTLDDLWRLTYFAGKPVTLTVDGGHNTRHSVRFDGVVYNWDADTDTAELRATIDAAMQARSSR